MRDHPNVRHHSQRQESTTLDNHATSPSGINQAPTGEMCVNCRTWDGASGGFCRSSSDCSRRASAWYAIRNRKPVGAWAGLTPTPHQSGQSRHELEIENAGNRHVSAMASEMAEGWLWWRPERELAQ